MEADDSWEPTTKPVIVCSANQLPNGRLLLGIRHWDTQMRKQFQAIYGEKAHSKKLWDKAVRFFQGRPQPMFGTEIEQGFVDQFGRFYNREEAMILARQNKQIIVSDHQMLSLTALHSEDLW